MLLAVCFAAAICAGLGPGTACGHEFWLAPSTYRAGPRDTLAIRALVGTGFRGEPRPYQTGRTARFTMHGATQIDLAPGVANGEYLWALLVPPDHGGQLIGYRSNFTNIELPAARFEEYLAAEGLDGPLAARRRLGAVARPGRERYARCAKTWVGGVDGRRSTRTLGFPLEIVPLANPNGPAPLRIRVLYQGKPLPNALVRTWNRALSRGHMPFAASARDSVAPRQSSRTASDGTLTLDVHRTGEWLVNVVHMVPSEAPLEADWQSLWASLTFSRKPGPR
ncbi:MAG: DUF4198 domain-containing protein [Candidatus Eisenbacteria bacterium]